MYRPVKDGIGKEIGSVAYLEEQPPTPLLDYVHCFWQLKTQSPLTEDFSYHVLPDACVNLLFDQMDAKITAVTALQTEHKVLNLGKKFHFVGVQLLPGVWTGGSDEIQGDLVSEPYSGKLSLVSINEKLISKPQFSDKRSVFTGLVKEFIEDQLICKNKIVATILKEISQIHTVSEMANLVGLSSRQLQRVIKESLRLSPHDFLKIIRLQQTFRENYLDYYADQSHFIHSFRKLTGYTPQSYIKKFDV